MYIIGIGTATPEQRYSQNDCFKALAASELFNGLSSHSQSLLKKVLNGSNGIKTRYLALNPLEEFIKFNPDALYARFLQNAPALATYAARKALTNANINAVDIDAIVISTCTGYLCPGLSSYVVEQLPLKPGIIALDLVGQGCVAALPNLQMAEALLALNKRCRTALSICVEVCSAAFYLDDDPGVLISACLFGDGAAAIILRNEPQPGKRSIEWKGSTSLLDPARRDLLRFEQHNGMLRNILTAPVPQLAAQLAHEVLNRALAEEHLQQQDICTWVWHTGGRDVLNALGECMSLDEKDLKWSREILSECGNMSSSSVLFVLERALNNNAPDGWWWMSSFGAGFSSNGALLRVGDHA
jgi:alkylresorcinol/alkylpyrone synthase